jgi:hypothetical protein
MGGSPKQVNEGQATGSYNNATGVGKEQEGLAKYNHGVQSAAMQSLFGFNPDTGGTAPTGTGTLTHFLDPATLDVNGPTGAFKTQYTNTAKNIDTNTQQAIGSLSREAANRGFGMGSNFTADQNRKTYLDSAATKGNAFADFTGRSQADATQNFWNANNMLAGQGAQAGGQAVQGYAGAGSTYDNLYGVAGKQAAPTGFGNALVGALGVAGAGAMTGFCPVEDSLITLANGEKKKVQELDVTDDIAQSDGKSARLRTKPQIAVRESCEVITNNSKKGRVSLGHAYMTKAGGYVPAGASVTDAVKTDEGFSSVAEVKEIGRKAVYFLDLGGNRTYCADGIWSLV